MNLISDKERKRLDDLVCDFKDTRKVEINEVRPVDQNPEIREFTEKFIEARGFSANCLNEIGLWKFSSVNMHIDSIHNQNYWTLVIPVLGRGEFAFYQDSDKILTRTFRGNHMDSRFFVFNDHRPHSFISQSRDCFAILADIHIDVAKKMV